MPRKLVAQQGGLGRKDGVPRKHVAQHAGC